MADLPRTPNAISSDHDDSNLTSLARAALEAASTPLPGDGGGEVLQVFEERLSVEKRRRATGSVQVGTRTEVVGAVAEVELDRYRVEVSRISIGRVVDVAPLARAEGDTTVIPVVEERLVLVKQLVLVEEVRIRHVLERETVAERVSLRRQRAVVDRTDRVADPAENDGVGPD